MTLNLIIKSLDYIFTRLGLQFRSVSDKFTCLHPSTPSECIVELMCVFSEHTSRSETEIRVFICDQLLKKFVCGIANTSY